MLEKPLPEGLHVILGDSAGGTFRRAFHPAPGQLIIDPDVLSCGPTPDCGPSAWNAMRLEYWKALVPGMFGEQSPPPSELVERTSGFGQAERVTIWAATSLSEQLFIAHVIHRLGNAADDKLLIVQFENLRGRKARIFGTGELTEEHIGDHPEPVAPSAQTLRNYRDLWAALTSADPMLMDRFAESHSQAGPWLGPVSGLMRRRFPDRKSGLTFWDRTLLREVRDHGPNAARVIGYTMADCCDDGDLTGDWYLFGRLLGLGNTALPSPMVKVAGGKDMRNTQVELTTMGQDVLEGRASNYPTNPIEDWTAGVKLSSSEGALWFDEGDRLVPG